MGIMDDLGSLINGPAAAPSLKAIREYEVKKEDVVKALKLRGDLKEMRYDSKRGLLIIKLKGE